MEPAPNPTFLGQTLRDFSAKIERKTSSSYRKPWMRTREMDIILEVLANIRPANCLEWGSGFSTLYFPELIPGLEHWYSLEHHSGWYERVKGMITDPRVEINLAVPDLADYFSIKGKYGPKLEGYYEDFKTYIEWPRSKGIKFDFIFIDGRARKECLKVAFELVSDRGAVIVHDANRDTYFEDLPAFHSSVRFTDYRQHRKEGGIWIGSKTRPVGDFLDIPLHQDLWRKHNLTAKLFFRR
ncbi:MAG: hypothetical protein ACKORJ_02115 [Bacteroidota bacterium]